MAQAPNQDLAERFVRFFRRYYDEDIGRLAQRYPNEQRSLYVDYDDLYTFDHDLAEDYLNKPEQMREYAEEALRLYDLPADVKLGQAHVRIQNISRNVDIRDIRVHDDHIGKLISVSGIVRKATDVRPKITQAAFECQRCGTMTYIPQTDGSFQEPHECQGCERQGPFRVNFDQSEFIDSQKIRVQESPEGLRGGETPQSIDVNLEDDVTGKVTAGDHVTVTGVLHIQQQKQGNEKSPIFDVYMDGVAIAIEDEEFEDMEITEEDKREIVELSGEDGLYEKMVESIAPSIYGFEQEKLAMALQLFSGVTKHLPDESRIRGDLHILLIGDPGTAKSQLLQYIGNVAPRSVYTSGKGSSAAGLCVTGDTHIHTVDGPRRIDDIAASKHPSPVETETAAEHAIEVYTYDEDGDEVTTRETSLVWRMPEKACRRLETRGGRALEASVNTPILTRGDDGPTWTPISAVEPGDVVAVSSLGGRDGASALAGATRPVADGGVVSSADSGVAWVEVVAATNTGEKELYDLTVPGTHNFLANGVVTHNTAAAVRDDFGDGQQWTLEAGALVLADKGVAAVDELDKMRSEDRSAMHQGLEQQEISISKAGINATLKARCSLLAAANPTYGRFDQYEPLGEQIDLEPALISRFDLIFTVTDQPDPDEDKRLAEHILRTNYAGELSTQHQNLTTSNYSAEDVESVQEDVSPPIDAEFLRKYVAYARRTCYPVLTEEAKEAIRDFYVDLRAKGMDEDAPVPVTARKLEALVRLTEASARLRLSDTATKADAERVIELVRYSLQHIGVDPETGEFDADVIETGTSKSQRDRIKTLKQLIADIEDEYEEGAPVEEVLERADEIGMDRSKAEDEIENLKKKGEVYEPSLDHLRTT